MKYLVKYNISKTLTGGNIFKDYEEKCDWCKENLKGRWEKQAFFLSSMTASFNFELEEDAMAFKLRWT